MSNKHTILEIKHFFTTYKNIQNKEVTIKGVGNAEDAKESIQPIPRPLQGKIR